MTSMLLTVNKVVRLLSYRTLLGTEGRCSFVQELEVVCEKMC